MREVFLQFVPPVDTSFSVESLSIDSPPSLHPQPAPSDNDPVSGDRWSFPLPPPTGPRLSTSRGTEMAGGIFFPNEI